MVRSYALWALFLALIPWALLLRPPRVNAPRVSFPALRLISLSRIRRDTTRRRLLRAALRSLAVVALVLLWADLNPDASVTSSDVAPELVAAAKPLRSILIVDGSDSNPDAFQKSSLSSARILELALDAQLADARIERVPSLDFAIRPESALRSCDATLLVDVPSLTRLEERALESAAQRGVGVVVWPGPNNDVERWNATLRNWQIDARIVDSKLEDAPRVPANAAQRAFIAAFPGGRSAALDALPCDRAILCVGPDAAPILRDRRFRVPTFSQLDDGICWFAFSPDPSFGALAAAPAFPALVEATTRYSLQPRAWASTSSERAPWTLLALQVALWSTITLAAFVEFGAFAPSRRRAATVVERK
ncbi:MAG: hypothetical protein ACOX0A_10290 [Thermoguttaceae bacterium]|jgi:hypothetical protein